MTMLRDLLTPFQSDFSDTPLGRERSLLDVNYLGRRVASPGNITRGVGLILKIASGISPKIFLVDSAGFQPTTRQYALSQGHRRKLPC